MSFEICSPMRTNCADARKASIQLWRMVSAVSIERKSSAQPVRTSVVRQYQCAAGRSRGNVHLRSRADGYELAVAIRRMVCRGHDSSDPETHCVAGIPRRILNRLERGARPRRQLFVHERRDQFHSDTSAVLLSPSNNAKFLAQPRIGAAWSPFGNKTVIRAGFGMYNDLQDALGYRMDQNGPFNPAYAVSSCPSRIFPSLFRL